jgi:hypothetical protein
VPTISPFVEDGGHGADAPLPTLRFGTGQLFALQIALSDVHSSAVNSGGPLGG